MASAAHASADNAGHASHHGEPCGVLEKFVYNDRIVRAFLLVTILWDVVAFLVGLSGEITNQIRVKIKNRSGADAEYRIELPDGPKAALRAPVNPIPVAVGESRTEPIFVTYPAAAFQHGQCEIRLRVSDGNDFSRELTYRLLGPQS